jgi:hypothetical protein
VSSTGSKQPSSHSGVRKTDSHGSSGSAAGCLHFIWRCHALVPPGREGVHLDLDAELDMLPHDGLS